MTRTEHGGPTDSIADEDSEQQYPSFLAMFLDVDHPLSTTEAAEDNQR